jgi:glutathione S-transferase
MQLFGSYTSPYVRHCRVTLAQAGIDFELVEADYTRSAKESPTAKVPYLIDGDVRLHESGSIIKYIRSQSGKGFLEDLMDYDTFAMSSTILDSVVNLFLIENDGYGPEQIGYLGRQKNRVDSGLKELNRRIDPSQGIESDGALRCACFLDWALFRNRINIDDLPNLLGLLEVAHQQEAFSSTTPPR